MFLARVYTSNDLNNSFDTAPTPGVVISFQRLWIKSFKLSLIYFLLLKLKFDHARQDSILFPGVCTKIARPGYWSKKKLMDIYWKPWVHLLNRLLKNIREKGNCNISVCNGPTGGNIDSCGEKLIKLKVYVSEITPYFTWTNYLCCFFRKMLPYNESGCRYFSKEFQRSSLADSSLNFFLFVKPFNLWSNFMWKSYKQLNLKKQIISF